MSDQAAVKPDVLDHNGNVIVNGDGSQPDPFDCMPIWREFSADVRQQVARADWLSGKKKEFEEAAKEVERLEKLLAEHDATLAERTASIAARLPHPGNDASPETMAFYHENMTSAYKNMAYDAAHIRGQLRTARRSMEYAEQRAERAKRYTTEITIQTDGGEPATFQCEFCPLGLGLYLSGRIWGNSASAVGVPGANAVAGMVLGLPKYATSEAVYELDAGTDKLAALTNGATKYVWQEGVDPEVVAQPEFGNDLPAPTSHSELVRVEGIRERFGLIANRAASFIEAWDDGHITNEQLSRTLCLHLPEEQWVEDEEREGEE